MTTYNSLPELAKFDRFFVGYDKMLQRMLDFGETSTVANGNYPPYNISRVSGTDNLYLIEIAIAGFARDDIDITLSDSQLTVLGEIKTFDDGKSYLHKGIANRSFKRVFTLAENVEVRSADLEHGMLKIVLESVIPEHKKPKKIEIGTGLSATQLLLENEADESTNG